MEEMKQTYIQDDEITLKELILKLQEFWKELWERKLVIILIALVFGLLFFLKSNREPVLFNAELTFMVNEDEGNSMGAMASVLGQFGLGGMGRGNSEFNLDKILELSRSKRIIYRTIMDTVIYDAKPEIVANHIINLYEFHKGWNKSKDENLHNFLFDINDLSKINETGQKALKSIYTKVVGNKKKSNDPLFSSSYGEETGILNLSVSSESEALSIQLANSIFKYLSEYYITKTIEPQQETVNALSSKTDSLQGALASAEYRLANYDDTNLSLFTQKDRVRRDRLQREVSILTIMYGEAVKNLETANFALQNKTPFFQVIDPPIAPISASPKSYLRSILIGLFLGGFLASLFYLFRKIFRDAMAG